MAAPPAIRRLAVEELVARCKRNAVEEWLHQSGLRAGLFAGLGAIMVVAGLEIAGIIAWGWCRLSYLSLLAFIVAGCSVTSSCGRMARFRCRHGLRELERRFGCLPLKKYVKAMRRAIAPDESAIILVAWGLPRGRYWWICVRIVHGGQSARVETRCQPTRGTAGAFDFGAGTHPQDWFTLVAAPVSPEVTGRLVATLAQLRPGRFRAPTTVCDGLPLSCAVIHGATKRITAISCNLAGMADAQADRPHIRLVKEVFVAGNALVDGSTGKK